MSKRIRFRSQVELADCGAACLAMALEFHGRPVPLDEVRTICGTGRDGTDALAIVEASAYYGLDARGVRAEIEDLEALPTATLLFWDMSHFVLLEDVKRRGIVIVDPASGRRFVKWDNVGKSYAGVAILSEPGEDFVPGGTRTRGLGRYLKPLLAQHDALRRVVVISLLLRVLLLSLPLLVAALVDRVVPTGDRSLLRVIALSLVVMVSVQMASSWVRGRLLVELRTRVDQKMTIGFLEHLVALPYTFHLRRSSGDLMMRLRINSAVRELLTSSTLSALLDGGFAVLYLILLLGVSFKLGLVVLGLGAAQVVVLILSRRATQRLASEGLQAEARSQGYAFQLLSGIETLKASGAEPRAVERFSGLFTDELAVSLARGRLSALVEAVMGALSAVSPLVVLTVAGLQVLDGRISLGTALAVNALASSFLGPLSALVSTGLSVQVLTGYVERLNDVFDTPREQEGEDVAPAPRLSGSITLERVSFRYTPLAPLVVRDVSVHIEPGMKVALVGRSGSGKTTLGHLLLGLYRPTTGRLLYDGLDLAGLEARSVRSQFGVVTQDPYLFATSIRENIAFGDPDMGLEPVRHAARLACVAEDIEVLPLGYDTVLGDGGSSLSGGQRQRLALARALATNPSVLLLDEATSHLDAVTESEVQKQIEKLGATTIIVAHRLSTVAKADLILVLDGGRVVERGTHQELLAQGGAYAELVHSQLDSETGEAAPKAAPPKRATVRKVATAPKPKAATKTAAPAPPKPAKKVAASATPKSRATASTTTRRTRSTP